MLVGEVAPLAPLLIPIGEILVWGVALAFCLLCVYIAKALFGTATSAVGWIPWFGKIATRSLTSIEQKIVSFMSGAAASVDAKMGAAFHELARVIDWLGRELKSHASLIYTLAQLVLGQSFAGILRAAVDALRHRVTTVESTADAALRRVEVAEKRLAHGIGEDVLPRVKSLEGEVAGVLTRDIPAIRARESDLVHGVESIFSWVRRHVLVAGSLAFAGAVAAALARLGLGWLRCNSVSSIGNRLKCSGFKLLEDLLFGVIDVLVIADLCQITKLMIDVAESSVIQDALGGIINGVEDLLLCQGVDLPPALGGYVTALPPAQAFSALPAV